ncbi:hypothetical protein ABPG75_004539 [Micractinium tetrahymenae]
MPPRARAGQPPTMDARLALREALAGLASSDLQQQSAFAAEALLHDADAPLLDAFLREALRMADCQAGSVRRLRYKLAGQALRAYATAPGEGGSLLAVRDLLIARVGLEDNGAAAAELAALAGQLATACIDAYCRGRYAALGQASKAGLPPAWLSELLLAPLLRAACRGPARTRVANACQMAHGVLRELRRWARSAGVLHAAVDCLKQMLKLTASGALALSAGDALLPVQGCVQLLGPRLKAAALEGILRLCTQAMQRGEWQVRKAAADTLTGLCKALLADSAALHAAGGAPLCTQQQQGLAALEGIAPAMAAAVEQHLRYDRIPKVRQAAASLLQLLQHVPGIQQQEQRPPAQQLQHGRLRASGSAAEDASHAAAAGDAPAAFQAAGAAPGDAAASALAPAASGLGRCRDNLKVLIADRRRQLQASGELAAAAAVKAWRPGGEGAGPGKPLRFGGGSSKASTDGEPGIRAWEDGRERPVAPAAPAAEADEPPPVQQGSRATSNGSRPPSAEAFAVAAAALGRLAPAGPAAARRRGWGSQPASPVKQGSPAKRASRNLPVQVFVARSPPPAAPGGLPATSVIAAGHAEQADAPVAPQAESIWRQNPLAQSADEPAAAAAQRATAPAAAVQQAGAALAVPCVHHVQHAQFGLRLQAAPPVADLRFAGSSPAAALRSVRLWAQEGGADVGIEFTLGPVGHGSGEHGTLHRYWLREGQLHHEQSSLAGAGIDPSGCEGMGTPIPQPAALEQQTPVAGVPSLPPEQQEARRSTAEAPLPVQPAASPAGVPAESPLASLATAVLPSFSPDKLPQAKAPAAAVAAGKATAPGVAAAAAAEGSTPDPTAAGWHSAAGSPPAAGVRSDSPVLQSHPAAAQWSASLRPPGEQLLPGLPDWDRSRPGSAARGSASSGSSRRRVRSPGRSADLGRLQRLQEQLQLNMQEIQKRLDEQQGPSPAAAPAPASSGSAARAGSLGSSEGMPAAWDAQEELPEVQHRYAPHRRPWGHYEDAVAAAGADQAAALLSRQSVVEHSPAADQQQQQQGSVGAAGFVVAVSNPLFGTSRPGTAESMHTVHSVPCALPPKRCLVVGRRRTSSESEACGTGRGGSPRQQRPQQRQRRRSPELSTGSLPSLGSLGSGFSALHQESEAEVQQFLRGSLAAASASQQPRRQPPRQQPAAAPPSAPGQQEGGSPAALHSRQRSGQPASDSPVQVVGSPAGSSCGSPAAGQQPAPAGVHASRRFGSLDLAAILGSRPPSPARPVPASYSSGDEEEEEAGPWQTARSGRCSAAGSGADGWETARSVAADGWATAREWQPQSGTAQRSGRSLWSPSSSDEWQGGPAGAAQAAALECPLAFPGIQQQHPWWTQQQRQQRQRQQQQQQQQQGQHSGCAHLVAAELQLLRIASRSPPPGPPAGTSSSSRARGSLADVVQQTFPAEAAERLAALKAQLSPGRQQEQHRQDRGGLSFAASPASDSRQQGSSGVQQQQLSAGAGSNASGSASGGSRQGFACGHQQEPASCGSTAGSQQEGSLSAGGLLAPRDASPELLGLGISRRQALVLQAAVGRMAGNSGESAGAADIQAALQDALVAQTAHVQAHYQQAAAARLAEVRRRHAGGPPPQLAAALQREAAALQAAQEAATRHELETFVEEGLPRLADILSSRPKLVRCFEAAAEGEGSGEGSGDAQGAEGSAQACRPAR